MLTAEEFRGRLPKLWNAIESEAVPSTRLFIEWLITLGLLKHSRESDLQSLLNRLLEFSVPTGTAVSTLTITMMVGCKLEEREFIEFYQKALDRIIPWLIHNNHMVRLFALYVFNRLMTCLESFPPYTWPLPTHLSYHDIFRDQVARVRIPDGYENIKVFLDQSEHNQRFLARLSKDWFLSSFDPLKDYNVQTIFGRLPTEAGIAKNECISMYSFMNINHTPGLVPFGEDPLVGRLQSTKEFTLNPAVGKDHTVAPSLKDYQQKIDPWDMSLLDQDLPELCRRKEIEQRKKDFDIIVVASLVDRIPNLAGLSRTCEIFGATSLTIPSKSILEDPNFKNISMTSECWLDVLEVTPNKLEDFLQGKRSEGYRIIAVEQSAQSHSLLYYNFPTRCCLVLGSEREGVPAEILHQVDDCVEIPQFGMIRSLNVHVTGSLILWEARRQRLMAQENRNY